MIAKVVLNTLTLMRVKIGKLDAKKSSVEYATKDDVKRLEEKLDALLSQNK